MDFKFEVLLEKLSDFTMSYLQECSMQIFRFLIPLSLYNKIKVSTNGPFPEKINLKNCKKYHQLYKRFIILTKFKN